MLVKIMKINLLACVLVLISISSAFAEQKFKQAVLHEVKAAELYRVEEGVFQLKNGQSMDLTDRKVLFTFREVMPKRNDRISVSVNGAREVLKLGDRVDLKKLRGTAKYFEGNEECFVDFFKLLVPKGAAAIASFRLYCE